MMVQSGTRVQEMDAVAWESTAVEVSSGPLASAGAADVIGPDDQQHAGGPDRSAIAALVTAAAAGDQNAWNGLVDKFASTVWAIARGYRLNAADAADVSQTTWLRLVENLDRIEQPERLGAWLATTSRRESLRIATRRADVSLTDAVYLMADGAVDPLDSGLLRDENLAMIRMATQ